MKNKNDVRDNKKKKVLLWENFSCGSNRYRVNIMQIRERLVWVFSKEFLTPSLVNLTEGFGQKPTEGFHRDFQETMYMHQVPDCRNTIKVGHMCLPRNLFTRSNKL